jgi:hypothetical protein
MNLNKEAHLFWRSHHGGGETTPASPARGVARSTGELMRRDGRFVWRPLRVQDVRGTGHGRGREPAGDLTAASARLLLQLPSAHFWPCQPSCVRWFAFFALRISSYDVRDPAPV